MLINRHAFATYQSNGIMLVSRAKKYYFYLLGESLLAKSNSETRSFSCCDVISTKTFPSDLQTDWASANDVRLK
jgi:hypothetical protein